MTKEKKKQLKTKARELGNELTTWARQNLGLKDDEELRLTLDVVKKLVSTTTGTQLDLSKAQPGSKQLSDKDWDRIFANLPSVPDNEKALAILKELHVRQNVPTALRDLPFVDHSMDMAIINKSLHEAGLPYSLRMLEEDRYKKVLSFVRPDGSKVYGGLPVDEKRYRVVTLETSGL